MVGIMEVVHCDLAFTMLTVNFTPISRSHNSNSDVNAHGPLGFFVFLKTIEEADNCTAWLILAQ